MRIYSMTATFGKLDHDTLVLQPGLNILHAGNEWGKSTWCAFLMAMLYGIETRVHSTKSALADKERYAPWSGKPMSGRIDLNWNGRDITIERTTKGRIPMGQFRAYETATGIEIPQLTAANCGQMLLGVEREVFAQAGFLRLTDLPLANSEALRRRLNALVTTGDESGAADRLALKLKELKNRCRYNRIGLLPQAIARRDEIQGKLSQLRGLQQQSQTIRKRQEELTVFHEALENHAQWLRYRAALAAEERSRQAREESQQAKDRLSQLEDACRNLPSEEHARFRLKGLQQLQQQSLSLDMEEELLPQAGAAPQPPQVFRGLSGYQAVAQAETDRAAYEQLQKRKAFPLWIPALLLALAAAFCWLQVAIPLGIGLAIASAAAWIGYIIMAAKAARKKQQAAQLAGRYESLPPEQWASAAQSYASALQQHEAGEAARLAMVQNLRQRRDKLAEKIEAAAEGGSLEEAIAYWSGVVAQREALDIARREYAHTARLANSFSPALPQPPANPDALTYSESDTARLLSDTAARQRQLQLQLGQCIGQMEQLGQESHLQRELALTQQQIASLEDHYTALTIALEALSRATEDLQRRFAPRIVRRATELFSRLTGGRYQQLTLSQDFTAQASAEEEDTLRSALWRSDGTADQLYIALRLAVAAELTPDAPLILDDALVRFDDTRLAFALQVLQEQAQHKQVILFTCQGRELAFMPS